MSVAIQAGPRALVRREQGWDLSISRSGISFRRFSCRYEDAGNAWTGPVSVAPASASPLRRLLWLVPLILGCGSLTAGVLAAPARTAAYSISRPIPDPPVRVAAVTPRDSHPKRRHRVPMVADDAGDGVAESVGTGSRMDDPAAGQRTDIAMRTGEMQSWRAGTARYFLVPGELRREDDKSCRQFSLLSRSDLGDDSVRQFERCRAAD